MYHRIITSRKATPDDKVYSEDGILQATIVFQAEVRLKLGEKSRVLTLNEALYIPSYMSIPVSLNRLNKIDIHHDELSPLYLYKFVNNRRRSWADLSTSKSGHWVLENLTNSEVNAGFTTSSSSTARKALVASPKAWHNMLGHPGIKAIESLPDNAEGCQFDSKETISTVDCEPCLLSKAKAIIFRRSEKNREVSIINEEKHMVVVSWDIVEFNTALDGSKYLSHF
ncbi:hypothetical protein K3495_g11809 [Podosphaera aphanis]|nr:hypothetical protein K3495_g11809 [Podosphaera aphanis]